MRARIKLNLAKRISTETPPIITIPKLKADLNGLSNTQELLTALEGNSTKFPFGRELILYLLLVASLWADNQECLLTASRIFAGALNFHIMRTPAGRTLNTGREKVVFGNVFPMDKLKEFNEVFFERVGGPASLLFCPSITEFHRSVWARADELFIVHDVIHFLLKAAKILPPKLRSVTFAYEAVARNIFKREAGYGVSTGPKRMRDDTGMVTTPGSVREKWKRAPETVILSYVLTEWFRLPVYDLATLPLFVQFCNVAKGIELPLLLSMIRKQLILTRATQNKSIVKWTESLDLVPLAKRWELFRLSEDELDHVFRLDQKVHQKPVSEQQQQDAREKAKTWGHF